MAHKYIRINCPNMDQKYTYPYCLEKDSTKYSFQSKTTFDKPILDNYKKYTELYQIIHKLNQHGVKSFLFGSSVWRCILDSQDGHDFDIAIEGINIDQFKKKILCENAQIVKVKHDDVSNYDNLRRAYIKYTYSHYKMTINNQYFDLIFVSDINEFFNQICDIDIAMLTYDINNDRYMISGTHTKDNFLTFDEIIKLCKEKKITCKYAFSSSTELKTSFSRFVNLIKDGFTYDTQDIAEIVCKLLLDNFCVKNTSDIIQTRFRNENLIDETSFYLARNCIEHVLKFKKFKKYDMQRIKLYMIHVIYTLNNSKYAHNNLYNVLYEFMNKKYDRIFYDQSNYVGSHDIPQYMLKTLSKKVNDGELNNIEIDNLLLLLPNISFSNEMSMLRDDITIQNIAPCYFSTEITFIKNIIDKYKNNHAFIENICKYSDDLFELVEKNVITINDATTFFNYLKCYGTLVEYIYLKPKIWKKCSDIYCNIVCGKHKFPVPITHAISSDFKFSELFNSLLHNDYIHDDDPFTFKYFSDFATTFEIKKINFAYDNKIKSQIEVYGKKYIRLLVSVLTNHYKYIINIESHEKIGKLFSRTVKGPARNVAIIIVHIYNMYQQQLKKHLMQFLDINKEQQNVFTKMLLEIADYYPEIKDIVSIMIKEH